MKATGALPTEDRVQRMNDQQWLWCYFNIQQDENEENELTKTRIDYLGWYIDHEKFKSVAGKSNEKEENKIVGIGQQQFNEDTSINDAFEEEMRAALAGTGENTDVFTELPDSNQVGNPNESKEDFLSRVLNLQSSNQMVNMEDIQGIDETSENEAEENIEDLDYFEYPDEI